MTIPMIIALAVTAFMVYLIMTEKVPFGAPPIIACALMVLFGVTDIQTAFRGFSNPSILMLAENQLHRCVQVCRFEDGQ